MALLGACDLCIEYYALHLSCYHHATDDVNFTHLEPTQEEGEQGRKINQYTRYGTVLIATAQHMVLRSASKDVWQQGSALWIQAHFSVYVVTLVGGTIFLMWLGELVTARGVGAVFR